MGENVRCGGDYTLERFLRDTLGEYKAMSILVELAERGILSDGLIRWGIRRLDKERLRQKARGDGSVCRGPPPGGHCR